MIDAKWTLEQAICVDAAEIVTVVDEPLTLPDKLPVRFTGQSLFSLATLGEGKGISASGALDAESLLIRCADKKLQLGKDYALDTFWGTLGLATESSVTSSDKLRASYQFSLRRIDSLIERKAQTSQAASNANVFVRKGKSHLTMPQPPALKQDETLLANVFIDYFDTLESATFFPISKEPTQPKTQTTSGMIPRAMAKIKAKQPLKIVCWGDSVTAGGDASCPEKRYTSVFEKMLHEKFPDAPIEVKTVAVGGSSSQNWLYPKTCPHANVEINSQVNWQNVIDAKPDLVTIEFVNDAGMEPADVARVYTDIMSRLYAIGAEIIFITPHFTANIGPIDDFDPIASKEWRPYVHALKQFAQDHHIALADASARWEHLQYQGLAYVTLLRNGINHPDDRGHALFAEELLCNFAW